MRKTADTVNDTNSSVKKHENSCSIKAFESFLEICSIKAFE